jgi:hypothetical protein
MAVVAFAVKDVVSMTLQDKENLNGLLGPLVQAQPPKFGVVTATDTGVVDVLWEDGSLVADIPVLALDLIGPPDAGVVASLQGFILKTDPSVEAQQESPEYQGIAVTFYTRQNGDGTVASPTETLCLMKINAETYREVLASTLTVAAGR